MWNASNPIRYCGEYYDSESGLIYLRARYYDSENGRFISEDPIKDGYNWYSYCGGNPVMFVDPSGLIDIKPDGSIYMDENDTETDRELLQLKINYANTKTKKERNDIAQEAEYIRKATTEPYKVLAQHTLESYMILDLTYENE